MTLSETQLRGLVGLNERVSLDEVNSKTMESRIAPGLHFVGEILDVDGRIGGFNFQWAWATAKVAGGAIARIG